MLNLKIPVSVSHQSTKCSHWCNSTSAALPVKSGCLYDGSVSDFLASGVCWLYSAAEPRLLWERVEKLVPRPTSNSGSGGSSSSSSSSNSSSQPGSHCGSGERFRARCEFTHTLTKPHFQTCRRWTIELGNTLKYLC